MDPFVRRLVQRLHDPSRPLSRNRHFHTFETPEGKRALKTSRRLRSLQQDILGCREAGHTATVTRLTGAGGECRLELKLEHVHGSRTTLLAPDEYELLEELPGVRDALTVTSGPQDR